MSVSIQCIIRLIMLVYLIILLSSYLISTCIRYRKNVDLSVVSSSKKGLDGIMQQGRNKHISLLYPLGISVMLLVFDVIFLVGERSWKLILS